MRTNRKVSQVWVVVILSWAMVVFIIWGTYNAFTEIDNNIQSLVDAREEFVEKSAR